MRVYLTGEQSEIIIDLVKTTRKAPDFIEFEYLIGGRPERQLIKKLAGRYFSSPDGRTWFLQADQAGADKILNIDRVFDIYRGYKPSSVSEDHGGARLVSQMPGKVIKIHAQVGDRVQKGQTLLVLEAMKMENSIKGAADGVVKAVHCREGQSVKADFLMMEIAPEGV